MKHLLRTRNYLTSVTVIIKGKVQYKFDLKISPETFHLLTLGEYHIF